MSSDATEAPTFEETFAKLSEIVAQLEEGNLPLADALAKYEQGIAAFRQCRATLEQAERRLELLTGVDAAGNPITRPFESDSSEGEEQTSPRRKRKTAKKDAEDDDSIPY